MRILFLLLGLLLSTPAQADDSSSQQEITKATLVSEYNAIKGESFNVGVILETKPGWHTYWENPGDAGMTTTLEWELAPGFQASPIDWPAPRRMVEGPLVTFSYADRVFLPVKITPPSEQQTTSTIKVKAHWLACKDICIPESATLALALPFSAQPTPTPNADEFTQHRAHKPQFITGNYHLHDKQLVLSIPLSSLKTSDITSLAFFPRDPLIQYAPEQKFQLLSKELRITLDASDTKPENKFSGLLTLNNTTSFDITFAQTAPEPPVQGFGYIVLLAVMGGLVLNLMPCVLPILSLKTLAIVKKSGGTHQHVVRLGIAYTLGILLSFALIAGILITLRQGGESIGWGYQMQSPAFVGFLIYLLFMVGLSLSGVFHFPILLGNTGGTLADSSSVRGSFFTGILATAVATPCTAPFMAPAIGAALTMPSLQAMLVFEALGFGLALPFLLISLFPRLRTFLPKPGAWMETFKQLMAFPMYASVIWLMWVLTLQTGANGMALALIGLLSISITLWMRTLFHTIVYRFLSLALYFLILALSLPALNHMEISSAAMSDHALEQGVTIVDYSKEALAQLRQDGKPVFIDATAAWCITCQVNAHVALHTQKTMDIFRSQGITLMIADWTRRNDNITEFLSEFGYKGVPLCVFYPAHNGKPVILPQILTENTVITILTQKEN